MACRLTWFAVGLIVIGCDAAKSPPAGSTPSSTAPVSDSSNEQGDAASQRDGGVMPKLKPGDAATLASSFANILSAGDIPEGWIQLFDGETLFGWKANSDLNWRVEDGVILADEGKPGLLQTTSRFADYELKCDVRVAKGGNSGLFLRTAFIPTDPAVDCYELNMCDSHPAFKTASLVKRAQPSKEVTADGEWHVYHVRVEGPRVTVNFDDEPILDYTDDTEKPLVIGHIGLQMNGGKAEFRNIKLKPLGMKPLFSGTDLSGWRVVEGSESEFDVQDGTIHAVKGRGFLETETTAGNFVLQFDAKTNGDKLNSGVFFRAMPGTKEAPSNGYEFQIQNGFKENDRTKPDDFGTGAIFRRVAARSVASNDREWFTATLIADGPHFTTWVNGYPVVDWTDQRVPNENPRNGLRLEAGHFSLQGHDPGTDLNFRNIRLIHLPD